MSLLERAEKLYPQFRGKVKVLGSPQVAVVDLGDVGRMVFLGCETCLEGLQESNKVFPDGKSPLPITALSADAVDHPAKNSLFVCPSCQRISRFETSRLDE